MDDGVAELVLRALRKPLNERFVSAAQMARALAAACASTSEQGFDVFINYRVFLGEMCTLEVSCVTILPETLVQNGNCRRKP